MKVLKAIEIKPENIAELWTCPYVTKIERMEYETWADEEKDFYISEQTEEPHFGLYLLGHKQPACGGYLVQDVHGLWRVVGKAPIEIVPNE